MDNKSEIVSAVKEWASPMLIVILGVFIWRDLSELRADVKFLVKEDSSNTVKIKSLETEVAQLRRDQNTIRYLLYAGADKEAIKPEEYSRLLNEISQTNGPL